MKKTLMVRGAYYTLDLDKAMREFRADFPDRAEYVDKCADEMKVALKLGKSFCAHPEGGVMVCAYASAEYISISCVLFVKEVMNNGR